MTTTGESIRKEAHALLAPLVDLAAPFAPGAEAPWDQLVQITPFHVDRAADCGASLGYEGEFDGWRSAFARRRVGGEVLERMRKGATRDPGAIARGVVEQLAREGKDGLGQWLGSLGPGGTSSVVREGTTFAVAARVAIRSWPPADGTTFANQRYTWPIFGRAVRLEASADGLARSSRSLLVFATSTTGEAQRRREVAWVGLVASLAIGTIPANVIRIDLASGVRDTVPLTDDVLDLGLTAAAAATEAAMAARYTAPLVPTPGRWCNRCRGRDVCPVAESR
jgi:hypothetical protein